MVSVGEPGGMWVLDRGQGQFLWSSPFPFDTPYFHVSDIDVETGKTYINRDQVLKKGRRKDTSFAIATPKATGPWLTIQAKIPFTSPTSTSASIGRVICSARTGHVRTTIPRPGSDPNALAGIAKVSMDTGQIQRFYTTPVPGNGAMLATAGELIFWGDINRRLRAFDADSGEILWETILGGIIQNSTITYSVNGKQYLAVLTGDGASATSGPLRLNPELKPPRGHNTIYVFALP